ncbi:hypothetical protein [Halomarina oriensis]|uniref:Uncharacterized protein n=1 Tax=Halomarina oriensis TaxID=671145 RepID=A0A6B0GVU4_9EURY|nr:hypothetical protein [Halomarina oriensis]MWG35828.1 hypothetical protein [Halomarina oriensis]
MTDDSTPVDGDAVRTFSSFPDGGLTDAQFRALDRDDRLALDSVAGFPQQNRLTHVSVTVDREDGERLYVVGWNPDAEEWEQLLTAPLDDEGRFRVDEDETGAYVDIDAITAYDESTGDPVVRFVQGPDEPPRDAVGRFLRAFVAHRYDPATDGDPVFFYASGREDDTRLETVRGETPDWAE